MPPKKRTSDVQTARGRLKGALNNVSGVGSDDEDGENYSEPLNGTPISQGRGRPPKRFKDEKSIAQQLKKQPTIATSNKLQSHDLHKKTRGTVQSPAQNTYIMKLFDRSVDLAKYNENTSLYPICRAWMLNHPRSEKIVNFRNKRTPSPEQRKQLKNIADDIRTGKITEIKEMPAIDTNSLHIKRIPSLLPFQMNQSKDNINLNYDLNIPLSKIEILNDLKKRWNDVRKNWLIKSQDYQERKYGKSMRLLEAIYKS